MVNVRLYLHPSTIQGSSFSFILRHVSSTVLNGICSGITNLRKLQIIVA